MNHTHFRVRFFCAAIAGLLTALSSTVFVTGAPQALERRITAHALAYEAGRAQHESTRTAALAARASNPAG